MTADELARGYFIRARKRLQALRTLVSVEAWPDVVREAQELVEPVLVLERVYGQPEAARALADAERTVQVVEFFIGPG